MNALCELIARLFLAPVFLIGRLIDPIRCRFANDTDSLACCPGGVFDPETADVDGCSVCGCVAV